MKVLGLLLRWIRACEVQETWTLIHSTRLQCDTVEPFHDVLRPWSGWSDLSGPGPTCKQEHWKLSTLELPLNGLPSLAYCVVSVQPTRYNQGDGDIMLACEEVLVVDKGGSNRMMSYKRGLGFPGFRSTRSMSRPGSEFSWNGFPYLIVSLMGASEPFLPFTSGR